MCVCVQMEELQEVQRINEEHQELTISAMQEEIRTLRHHNQDLLQRVGRPLLLASPSHFSL